MTVFYNSKHENRLCGPVLSTSVTYEEFERPVSRKSKFTRNLTIFVNRLIRPRKSADGNDVGDAV